MDKRLYKTENGDKMICGVFGIDPTLVRVGWVIAGCMASFGMWAYILCAIVMPRKSDVYPQL